MTAPKQIPSDHIPLVVNSLLAERLFGFQRQLGPDGVFFWLRPEENGQLTRVEGQDLQNFAGDPGEALGVLGRWCEYQNLGYAVTRLMGHPHVQVTLHGLGKSETAEELVRVVAAPVSLAISLSILRCLDASPMAQHRILYPGHYLLEAH